MSKLVLTVLWLGWKAPTQAPTPAPTGAPTVAPSPVSHIAIYVYVYTLLLRYFVFGQCPIHEVYAHTIVVHIIHV
jgi:hypothetical protein